MRNFTAATLFSKIIRESEFLLKNFNVDWFDERKNSVKSTCLLKNSTLNWFDGKNLRDKKKFNFTQIFSIKAMQFRVEFFSKQVDLTEFLRQNRGSSTLHHTVEIAAI